MKKKKTVRKVVNRTMREEVEITMEIVEEKHMKEIDDKNYISDFVSKLGIDGFNL